MLKIKSKTEKMKRFFKYGVCTFMVSFLVGCRTASPNFCLHDIFCYYPQTFATLDVNHDQKLSMEEMARDVPTENKSDFFVNMDFSSRKRLTQCNSIRKNFDLNQDGFLTKSEFNTWRSNLDDVVTSPEQRAVLDENESETISMSGYVKMEMLHQSASDKLSSLIKSKGLFCEEF